MVLHGDEACAARAFGQVQQAGKLPGIHAGGAEVARLAGLHHIVQRVDDFFHGCDAVETVNLVDIDVIGAKPPQGLVDGMQNVLA